MTGRKNAFLNESEYGSVSGYTNPAESEHDFFNVGHTSTSISLACGMAKFRDLKGGDENIVAVIGDASLDGGQSFEALNLAGELKSGLIVVVNDNDMSIPENHGALGILLNELSEKNGVVKDNYFSSLGFDYVFVKDGNDINSLIKAFSKLKNTNKPVVVHCRTKKGFGYEYAEKEREKWHWAHPFSIEEGKFLQDVPKENYGAIVAEHLLGKMKEDSSVVVVTASTPLCIGFNSENRKKAGSQFLDVGIAEQNAVSLSAGIAKMGGKPVFATNSTFFQRAYDQIEQEIGIGSLPVTMIVTHASVFGHTNDTHVGIYDMALFSTVPNLVYLAPTNKQEYLAMLDWSLEQREVPVAIRVPWCGVEEATAEISKDYAEVKYETVVQGSDVAVLALGGFFSIGKKVISILAERNIHASLINPRFITGVDKKTLEKLKINHSLVVTLEDGILNGGFGSKIACYYSGTSVKVLCRGFPVKVPNRYDAKEWLKENRITPEQIAADILESYRLLGEK